MMEFKRIDNEKLNEKLLELQKLIDSKGNLPQNIDKILLLRYLKFFNGNTEKALKRLMASIDVRKCYSNIFYKRDTLNLQLRRLIEQVEMFLMPKLTADNDRIMIIKLIDFDPDNIIFEDALSVFSMVYDTTMITPEHIPNNELADGEILIFDLNGVTPRHLMRLGFSSLRCFFRYMIEAHPMRIKQIHLINCSSMVDKISLFIRPFITSNAMKVMHFHSSDSKTLFDYIPYELLPIELGGTDGSLDGPKWYWIRRTEDHREYLLDDERWMIKDEVVEKSNDNLTDEDSFRFMGFC